MDEIEQLLIEKSNWIDGQLKNFPILDRTTDLIELIHQQASDRFDDRLRLLHQKYNQP